MNAIITTSKKTGTKTVITARTASGKLATRTVQDNLERYHRLVAQSLSERMGWGTELHGGETKDGFAYIPAKQVHDGNMESAVKTLVSAAAAFPTGEKDPIRLANGIIDLMKAQRGE